MPLNDDKAEQLRIKKAKRILRDAESSGAIVFLSDTTIAVCGGDARHRERLMAHRNVIADIIRARVAVILKE